MDEVVVGGEVIGEDGVFFVRLRLLLAGVQREGSKVFRLVCTNLELDVCRFLAIVIKHAVSGVEESPSIKTLRN